MTRPTLAQLQTSVGDIGALLAPVPRRLHAQIERERRGGSAVPDGYPASSLGGGGGSEATSVERAVIARVEGVDDEHRRLTRACEAKLHEVRVHVDLLVGWLSRMEANATVASTGADGWCEHHARHGMAEPAMVGVPLCAFCDGLNREFGAPPPKGLLLRRQQGERITEAHITACYGALRSDAARKRKARVA